MGVLVQRVRSLMAASVRIESALREMNDASHGCMEDALASQLKGENRAVATVVRELRECVSTTAEVPAEGFLLPAMHRNRTPYRREDMAYVGPTAPPPAREDE